MDDALTKFVGVLVGITGLAIVAVVLSQKSNAAGVIQAFFSGFGNILGVAVSPISGSSVTPNLTYPTTTGVANAASQFLGGGSDPGLANAMQYGL